MIAADIYVQSGYPLLKTWAQGAEQRLLPILSPEHPNIKKLREIHVTSTEALDKKVSAVLVWLSGRSPLLWLVSLQCEVSFDDQIATTTVEKNKISINPYVLSHTELGKIVLVRALLRMILLHAYDPNNPENSKELSQFESQIGVGSKLPSWLAKLEEEQPFHTPTITKQEALLLFSLVSGTMQIYQEQDPLYQRLVTLGYVFGSASQQGSSRFDGEIRKILSGAEGVLPPAQAAERFSFAWAMSQAPREAQEAFIAFRWAARTLPMELVMLLGRELLHRMRAKNQQGLLVLSLQRDQEMKEFFRKFQETMGIKTKYA